MRRRHYPAFLRWRLCDDANRAQPFRIRCKAIAISIAMSWIWSWSSAFDDIEIVLRPKTLAVLRFLVENPGRLVSKEDLFAAVWPNIAVTDDVLVQSVGELRRALANDGQRLIKTIPRRGYRFELVVSAELSANPTPVGDGTATASMDDGILAFRMPNAQKALISIFRGDWRRALAVGLGLAVLIFATVLLTDRSGRDLGAGYPIAEN